MAQAVARFTEQEVTVTETVKDGVSLDLTNDEAQFIADLLSRVGGDPERSRRKLSDGITKALEHVGYTWGYSPFSEKDFDGDLYFSNTNQS